MREGTGKLDIHLAPDGIDELFIYFSELIHWSRKMNLVGRRLSHDQIIENHFIDSLTLLPLLDGTEVHLLDVGSGAGFPGLVCKAVKKDLKLTIVEPRLKRVSFLNHIIRTLEMKTVQVLPSRLEETSLFEQKQHFNYITGRAVTELADFLDLVQGLVQPGVKVICMKGSQYSRELEAAHQIMADCHLSLSEECHLQLPFSGAKRALLVFTPKS